MNEPMNVLFLCTGNSAPMTAHWGIPDPAAVQGTDDDKRRAMSQASLLLTRRLSLFVSLPVATLDRVALKKSLDSIGELRQRGE